jgi:excisionase family DNA binding protein
VTEPTADAPLYMTPKELAFQLRLHRATVCRMAEQDASMPQLRIGGSLRFPRERVLRWLRQREGQVVAPRRQGRKSEHSGAAPLINLTRRGETLSA